MPFSFSRRRRRRRRQSNQVSTLTLACSLLRIELCYFSVAAKMGWGDCTESVMDDSIKPLEDAFRLAWDSTAEVLSIVTDTVKNDMQQVGFLCILYPTVVYDIIALLARKSKPREG